MNKKQLEELFYEQFPKTFKISKSNHLKFVENSNEIIEFIYLKIIPKTINDLITSEHDGRIIISYDSRKIIKQRVEELCGICLNNG